ncbi:Glycosyltransferase involved in cell wall bisynthesis [Methanobrevibacter olleyae]|uniref:Glycosyltransferase involved in cell wall bisynthesis n=1 Tax=Methanobrevibacter olleyae TaxID=294671 RepID=A0A1I4JJ96_METOL|nr:glycosyltransferase [Methanobrevibacter olleyae]SFL66584.1 Glycosyltransferase involved in cell wall bisynthesis [Methanobrevibacter olleyae]
MVKVSVIIPIYNVENFLNDCLDSIVNQSLTDIEVICIDDGSTDNSLAILQSYAKFDDRVKIIHQDNKGSGATRNLGIEQSTGDYVYFMDSDDYIDLNALEKLYNNAVSNNSDFVIFKIARFDKENDINYNAPGFDIESIFGDVDYNNFTFKYSNIKHYVMNASFAPWIKLYKKEFLDRYNDLRFPKDLAYEDVPFHVKIMLYASRISFIPEFLYFYRLNPNSRVHTSNSYDIFKIIDIVEKFLIDKKYYDELKDEFDLFKITQILNYILSIGEEEYFQKTKEEFSKIKISSQTNISEYYLERYDLVLRSNNLIEYINEHYEICINNLNKVISNLNGNISNLNEDINQLNVEKNFLEKDISNLKSKNEFLSEKCDAFKCDLDCLSNKNKKLINRNKKLMDSNRKYKRDLKAAKKFKTAVLNSNSWKLTKPLRFIRKKI